MELSPASIAQVEKGRDGRMVVIDDDVGSIVRQLTEIDPELRVRWSELGEYFVVYHEHDGEQRLVLTAQELDARIVKRVQKISSEGYDFLAEMEKQDAAAERAHDERLHEQVAEIGARFAHAARKDLGLTTDRAVVPKDVP